MKKVLFTATVDSHILHFHTPYLKLFKDNGYEVHVATNGTEKIPYCDKKHVISFERSPFKINNLKAIRQLKKVIDKEEFDIIHTHTPMGSVVTRLAAKKARKKGTRVIYTAHGFHFYKGAPLLNWALFYPIEKWLSKYTDTLITINQEDYQLAKNKFKKTNVEYVPGVGIDPKKFDIKITEEEKNKLRKELDLKKDDFVMIYPAELSNRKRQVWLINTLKDMLYENKDIHLLLPGKDSLNGTCHKLVKELNLEKQIHLLGYRKDIQKLLRISNLAVSSAKQEGLPVNLMEAMYVGIPIVASNCRGNRDLVENDKNGYIIDIDDSKHFVEKILSLKNKETKIKDIKINNVFVLDNVMKKMKKIYTPKKKVLHLLASNKYSGAENVVCTMINSFKDEINMAYCSPIGEIKEVLEEKKINYYGIKKINTNEIKKVIKTYNPDIIYAHDFKASILASVISYKGKIISHLHKNDPAMKKISIKSIMYYLASKKIYKIVGVSKSVLDEYIFKNSIKDKFNIFYNFVDSEEINKKAQKNKLKKKYNLCYIGRLSPEKNPLMFIEILRKINESKKTTAVLVGDGILKEECIKKINKYQLQEVVELVGFQKNPYPYILNSDMCIMPSKFEGFGLVAIESMILNKPVLNSGAGGLKEIFKDDDYYICNNIDEYVSKIIKLSNQKKSLVHLTEKFTNKNDWKNKIKDVLE